MVNLKIFLWVSIIVFDVCLKIQSWVQILDHIYCSQCHRDLFWLKGSLYYSKQKTFIGLMYWLVPSLLFLLEGVRD